MWVNDNLGVMSIGFMLPSKDDAVIWRGPKKNGTWRCCRWTNDCSDDPRRTSSDVARLLTSFVSAGLIKQFLTDVDWGELDYLVIDSAYIPRGVLWRICRGDCVDGLCGVHFNSSPRHVG